MGVHFQCHRVAGAGIHAHNNALAVDPEDGWNAATGNSVGVAGLPAVDEHTVGELVLFKILLDDIGVFVPGVDGEDDQSVLVVLVGEPGQVRSLRTAGRSAIGEEGE